MSYNRRVEKVVGAVTPLTGSAHRKLAQNEDAFVLNGVLMFLTAQHTATATISVQKNGATIQTASWPFTGVANGDSLYIKIADPVDFGPGDKLTVACTGGTAGGATILAVGGILPK